MAVRLKEPIGMLEIDGGRGVVAYCGVMVNLAKCSCFDRMQILKSNVPQHNVMVNKLT